MPFLLPLELEGLGAEFDGFGRFSGTLDSFTRSFLSNIVSSPSIGARMSFSSSDAMVDARFSKFSQYFPHQARDSRHWDKKRRKSLKLSSSRKRLKI